MRLLTIHEPLECKAVHEIQKPQKPYEVPYVIISHRWFDDELDYDDMSDFANNEHRLSEKKAASIKKVKGSCEMTKIWSRRHNANKSITVPIKHVWLDTVCINKKNPAELSESLNSMYRWYEEAAVCFVYLHDYKHGEGPLSASSWFTRGWTLQELVAPSAVEFYDRNWKYVGDRESLKDQISQITRTASDILSRTQSKKSVRDTSISHRMSWFAGRITEKGEDNAYSLMGLFDVYMPTIYGEGKERAFRRLQEEIMKYSDDQTLFAWADKSPNQDATDANLSGCGLLAPSPYCFEQSGSYVHGELARISSQNAEPFFITNQGLSISLHLFNFKFDLYIASFDFLIDRQHHLGIYLKRISPASEYYERIYPWKLCQVKADGRGERKRIYIRQKSR
jgi:hypothetical protein